MSEILSRRSILKGLGALGAAAALPRSADAACCYFAAQDKDINQPGQKAFVTWDPDAKVESFTVQPKFEGNALDFGMVIPTPSRPKLDEMPRDFFKDLAVFTILMPLPQVIWTGLDPAPPSAGAARNGGVGGKAKNGDNKKEEKVKVLEAGVVGSLDYKIILAEEAAALFDWLKENSYVYSGDTATLDFYVKKKWVFTVMKIDPKQMKKNEDGSYLGVVTPTRFTFASDSCVYPLKITQISVKDRTDALFYVQSPKQMDLEGDLSWMHSYRVMWLTYMLGCSANEEQQQELTRRSQWVEDKKRKDPKYDTTKLEWARRLGETDAALLDDPEKHYAQAGGGDLPEGFKFVTLAEMIKEVREGYEKGENGPAAEHREARLRELEKTYAPEKGRIVLNPKPGQGFWFSRFLWYPNREAPAEAVKGLARLKGHLQKDRWVTKFRKILRRDEMTDDLKLVAVADGSEQEYVRIMPTSPP
jgi:hypothetical protein